jgi:hypothetical protein
MLLVFPLFTGFEGYTGLTSAKYAFFVAATAAWLMALAVFGCIALKSGQRPSRPNCAQAACIVFMLVCCVSAAASPYGADVLIGAGRYDGLVTLLLYGAIFLGVSAFGQMKAGYVRALGVSSFLCCAVAILQLCGINALWLFPNGLCYYDSGIAYTSAFLGTIGNTNILSAFLCLSLPATGVLFLCSGQRRDALLSLPIMAGIFVLIRSGVAGGVVGLLGCAIIAVPLVIREQKRLVRAFWLLCAVLIGAGLALGFSYDYADGALSLSFSMHKAVPVFAAAVLCAAVGAVLRRTGFPKVSARGYVRFFIFFEAISIFFAIFVIYSVSWQEGTLAELSQLLHGTVDDSFGSSRIGIWRAVLALVPERWLLGGGPDTLALRLDVSFSRYVPETGKTLSVFVDNAHNEYLGYLANLGVLGLGAFLAMMALSVFRRRDWAQHEVLCCALCGVICYWIQSFFGLGLCITAPVMWILWGLICSKSAPQERIEPSVNEEKR